MCRFIFSISYPPAGFDGVVYGDGKSATRYHLVIARGRGIEVGVEPPTSHHRTGVDFGQGPPARARVLRREGWGETQGCATGAATSRRRGCLRAISRPYLCRDTPIVMVEYLRVSNLREMLFCRQTDSLENLGESRVGAQRVQPRLPLGVNKKCGTLGDCLL
jgi:hypothetical protein